MPDENMPSPSLNSQAVLPWHRRPLPAAPVLAILETVLFYATTLDMPWWFTCVILFVMGALLAIVVIRSEWTVNLSGTAKGFLCVVAAVVVVGLGWKTIRKQWNEASPATIASAVSLMPSATAKYLPLPLTLRNLFDTDFSDLWAVDLDWSFTRKRDNVVLDAPTRLLIDFNGNAAFLAFFIPGHSDPANPDTFRECVLLAGAYQLIVDYFKRCDRIGMLSYGDTSRIWLTDAIFTRRIFLYYEDDLSLSQMSFLEQTYRQNGLSVEFRGRNYLAFHRNDKRAASKKLHVVPPFRADM